MLDARIIQPSQSPYSSPIVMVHKNEGPRCIHLHYKEINNMTITNKVPILVIDELLDEVQGFIFFKKLELLSRYQQIILRKIYI